MRLRSLLLAAALALAPLAARPDTTISTGGFPPVTVAAGGATLSRSTHAQVNTSGGAFSVTLPTNPPDGAELEISDVAGTFDTANLTITPGVSDTIEGAASKVVSTEWAYLKLKYDITTRRWIVLEKGTGGGVANLDAIPDVNVAGAGTNDVLCKSAGGDWVACPPGVPGAHAASHQHLGSDEIATATPAANAIPKADGTGKLPSGFIPEIALGAGTSGGYAGSSTEGGSANAALTADAGSGPIVRSVSTATCPSGWFRDMNRSGASFEAGTDKCEDPEALYYARDYSDVQSAIDAAPRHGSSVVLPHTPSGTPHDFSIPIVVGGLKNANTVIGKSVVGYGAGQRTNAGATLAGSYLRYVPAVAEPSTTTVGSGSAAGTLVVADSLTTNQVKHRWVRITSGAASGQMRLIRSVSGSTLTIEPDWTTIPANGDTYVVETKCAFLIAGSIGGRFQDFIVDGQGNAQFGGCLMGENLNSSTSQRNSFENITFVGGTVKAGVITGLDVGGADSAGINDQIDTTTFTNVGYKGNPASGQPGGLLVDSINALILEWYGGACYDFDGWCFDVQRGGATVQGMLVSGAASTAAGAMRARELAKEVIFKDNRIETNDGAGIFFDPTDFDSSGGFGRFGWLTVISGNSIFIGETGEDCLLYQHGGGSLVLTGNQCGLRDGATAADWIVQSSVGGSMQFLAGANALSVGAGTVTWPSTGAVAHAPPRVTAFPGAPSEGDLVFVTDDPTPGACSSAGGSAVTLCARINGAWVPAGGDDDAIGFDDADGNWTAGTVGAALEELDDLIGGGVPNQATGKVSWSQLVNVPAGFADNTDDGGAGVGVALDLGDNGTDESTGIVRINVSTDPTGIFSEPVPDELLFNIGEPWPSATNLKNDGVANAYLLAGAGLMIFDTDENAQADAWLTSTLFTLFNQGITLAGVDKVIEFEGSSADAFETLLGVVNPTADLRFNLPNLAAGTYDLLTRTGTETVTGKTIAIASNSITSATGTRCARFDASNNLVAATGDCPSGDTTSSGAPAGAQYLTLATDAGLSAERTIAAAGGLTTTDGGANNPFTIEFGTLVSTTRTVQIGSSASTLTIRFENAGAGGVFFEAEPHPTDGGRFGAFEGQDDGTNFGGFTLPNSGLASDRLCGWQDDATPLDVLCMFATANEAGLEAAFGGVNLLVATELDTADKLATLLGAGDFSGTGAFVRVSGGSLTGAQITDFLEGTEAAAPATPAAGKVRLYAKTGAPGAFCSKDDAGVETCMGASGGGTLPISFSVAGCNVTSAGPSLSIPQSNGPTANCYGTDPFRYGALDFADGATALTANFSFSLAQWSGGTIALTVHWMCSSGTCSTNNTSWKVATFCSAPGDVLNSPTFNAAQEIVSAGSATQYAQRDGAIASLTTTGCSEGEILWGTVQRDPADADDTLAGVGSIVRVVAEMPLQ